MEDTSVCVVIGLSNSFSSPFRQIIVVDCFGGDDNEVGAIEFVMRVVCLVLLGGLS